MKPADLLFFLYTILLVTLIGLWSVGVTEVTNTIISIALLLSLVQYFIYVKMVLSLVTSRFPKGNFHSADMISSVLIRNTILFVTYSSGHMILFGFMLPAAIISTIVSIFSLLHKYDYIQFDNIKDEE